LLHRYFLFFTELSLREDQEEIEKWCISILKYIGIGFTIITIIFFVVGENLIELVFGRKYDGVFENTFVLIFGIFPMAIAQLGYTLSVISKEPYKYFFCILLAFAIFMLSAILLIPKYKALGCSIAMSISYTMMAIMACFLFKKKIWLCLPRYILSIALGVISLPAILLKDGLTVNIMLVSGAVIVYLAVLMSTRTLSPSELRAVASALRMRRCEVNDQAA
jgi:O-antigen/teichoic acid export membrane protein